MQKLDNSIGWIAVLDFGSQYTQLIARKIRELGVKSEIVPYNISPASLKSVKGIVLSGGPKSVYQNNAPMPDFDIFNLNKPILGICYGMQTITYYFNGKVEKAKTREYGYANLKIGNKDLLFSGIPQKIAVWMSHGDKISSIPDDFIPIAYTENSPYAAIKNGKIYGIQFHPEVKHTEYGKDILKNFVVKICKANQHWKMESFVKNAITEIKNTVKNKKAILALSGGVDSSVCAVLAFKALKKNFIPVFVDTGLMRKGESEEVKRTFRDVFKMNLKIIDASSGFLKALKGINSPERKRKIIGEKFIRIFEREAKESGAKYLIQGTLYPDRIESKNVLGPSSTIKTHHNVGGLPDRMTLKLIEPLKEIFKDEVRKVAEIIGLPDSIKNRHPFPGPGLAVRIIGQITNKRLQILKEADAIYIEELRRKKLYNKIWQAFAVLIPVRTVGVMGDLRTYEYTIALRAVDSVDGMTADWYHFPDAFLRNVSNRIINEVKGVNRVVYDISSKPPSTIEWE